MVLAVASISTSTFVYGAGRRKKRAPLPTGQYCDCCRAVAASAGAVSQRPPLGIARSGALLLPPPPSSPLLPPPPPSLTLPPPPLPLQPAAMKRPRKNPRRARVLIPASSGNKSTMGNYRQRDHLIWWEEIGDRFRLFGVL